MYDNSVICYIVELAMRSSAWLTSLSLPRSPDVVQPNSGAGAQEAPGYKSLCAFLHCCSCPGCLQFGLWCCCCNLTLLLFLWQYWKWSPHPLHDWCQEGESSCYVQAGTGDCHHVAQAHRLAEIHHPLCILWWRWSIVLLVLLLS